MPSPPLPILATLLLALAPGAASADPVSVRLAQFFWQKRSVVRVPKVAVQPTSWVEKKGPKCIPLDGLAGVLVTRRGAIDLVQLGGARVRAELDDDCPALDFYSGLYIRPTDDGRICADRDAVRTRSGRVCEIERFRKLVPKR